MCLHCSKTGFNKVKINTINWTKDICDQNKKEYVNPSEEYRDFFSNREYFINKFNNFTYTDRFK